MPNVLHVERLSSFWERMDRNHRHRYERVVAERCFTNVDLSSTPVPNIAPGRYQVLLSGEFAQFPEFPVAGEGPIPAAWFEQIPKRCLFLEDMHLHPESCRQVNRKFNYLLACYDCPELYALRERCPNLRKAFIIPHHLDTAIYRDYGLPKLHDVLLYGNTDASIYPFRRRLHDLLAKSRLRVKIVEDPGYDAFDPDRCGESLARTINQSWISIATPSKFDYLVAKYFEIGACGSVVAGKMPAQGEALWRDRYIRLTEEMTDQEIIGALTAALLSPERLRQTSEEMRREIHQNYSLDCYCNRLVSVVREIILD
jgi:Glycosyl transferases group 1